MSDKLEVEMPNHYPFSFEMPIRKIDVTLDIHVSFATILDIVFEGHMRFFKFMGHDVTDVYGKSLIFANAIILYKGELLADDVVKIEVCADNFIEKGCDLFFHLSKDNGKIPVADVKIRMLFFDYAIRKVALVPAEFKAKCLKLLNKEKEVSETSIGTNKNSPLWNKAHQFVLNLYQSTNKLPKEEMEHLIPRIRKAATSLPLSIVEGTQRKEKADILKAFGKTRGFIEELRYYLILANDLKYLDASKLLQELEDLNNLLKTNYQTTLSSL
jgi:four helix bundle protein